MSLSGNDRGHITSEPAFLCFSVSSPVLRRSTIQLLRFHFSFFLLPVYLFALSQLSAINWKKAALIFVILHLLVYPSSNGYNSYMDRDESPIGGVSAPLAPTRQLFYASVMMDILALLVSFFISGFFALGILLYILASRAYSYRGIRLKRFPITGFLTVFLFQGAVIFVLTYYGSASDPGEPVPWLQGLISSFLIGALYPLTQVYQHEEDRKDGVTTISFLVGKRGTFLFSMSFFMLATFFLFLRFHQQQTPGYFFFFLIVMFPVIFFFFRWMRKVWHNKEEASYRNSLQMNMLSSFCTSVFFLTIIILNH